MSDRGPFIEIYWKLADEYPEVWDDDHALAWFARLLRAAEAVWPTAADRPEGIPSRTWRVLTAPDGLIVPEGSGRRFRVRGMDAKRNARRSAASNAARTRWGSADRNAPRNAQGNAETMPKTRTDQNRPEIPPTPAERGHDGSDHDGDLDAMPGNPRANGTNPRAVASREASRRRDAANEIQMRYLRGELTEDEHRRARHEAGLS